MFSNGEQPDYDRWALYVALVELSLNLTFWLNR